jgi:Putative transposase/Transposase zinc-binding domain
MREHRLEVADVFHAHENEFLQCWGHALSDQQRKVLRDIGRCRTAALGMHIERCDRCSYETVAYDSCRNQHCPKCQSSARDRWLMKQASGLLPVPYAHVVFTVPEQLAPLALRNQRLFYILLFRAASETLLEIADDARRLGARIGVLAVLHTWSQNLSHHPHLHCLVPAGGLAALDPSRWVASRRGFFLPVRVLSRMFRGKLLAFLKQSYRRNQLCFPGKLVDLSAPRTFHSLLHTLRRREWVVYSKPPFGGPEHVLKYLARYTHRVAISNGRLLSLDNGQVRFRWRIYGSSETRMSP